MPLSPDKARQLLATADRLYPAAAVGAAVTRLAREISERLELRFPLVLSVMRGSVIFAGQLLPQLGFPLEFDYLDVTRYGISGPLATGLARPSHAGDLRPLDLLPVD